MLDHSPFSLGLSSCPNDTFIFHALLHNMINNENLRFAPRMADVQQLNDMAVMGLLDITKLSLGVIPHVFKNYAICSAGAALGWGCGPLIIAKNGNFNAQTAKIAIPGKYTTANLLLDLCGEFGGERIEMLFSDIIPAVASGEVDLGVIIHEGRFTYANYGLIKIMDMGEWWEQKYQMPLPLGAIAIRRDIPKDVALHIQDLIAQSLDYAWSNPHASSAYIKSCAQELNEEVTKAHIETFVTAYSRDLGQQGKAAIQALVSAAMKRKISSDLLFME